MDFQVREPISSIIGQLPRTNLVMEVQAAQEYTGQQIHLCNLLPQWREYLDYDTQANGTGSTIARVISGELNNYTLSGMAAVSNLGNFANWTGHILAGANTYGFGRLAWDPTRSSESINRDWAQMVFGPTDDASADDNDGAVGNKGDTQV